MTSSLASTSARPAPVAPGDTPACAGCYRIVGGWFCYRALWTEGGGCKCGWCLEHPGVQPTSQQLLNAAGVPAAVPAWDAAELPPPEELTYERDPDHTDPDPGDAGEYDPGDMGEPPLKEQPVLAAEQGHNRLVYHTETLVVCDYDQRRAKHSRCGDRLTPLYKWITPAELSKGPFEMCPACDRRTAVEATGAAVTPCSSCGALMYWGRGARGGRLPVSIKTGASHFADCPNAATHSKARKG